jgi:hypothetical protein
MQPPTDCLSPLILNLPNVPTNDLKIEGTYAPPLLSSRGIFTADEGSWKYFDFDQAMEPTPLANTTTATGWTQANPQAVCISCVPHFLINDPLALMAQDEDDNSDKTADTISSNVSSPPTLIRDNSPLSLRKAALSCSKEPRLPSKSTRHSSRIKENAPQPSTPRRKSLFSSLSSSSKGRQLRKHKTRPEIPVTDDAGATESIPIRDSRSSHNMIEKQYRTRLNGQFSSLLDALPLDVVGAEIDGYADSSDCKRKVSKGEVLVLARRYIQSLEHAKRSLD